MPERQLSDALEQLVRAELLFQRGTPPNAQYTFKHALVQDVAYASLLRSNRQQLHARIATVYETRFAEVVRAQPELVAHHFTEAGLSDAAIEYWQRAGDLAMARSGHAEAIHHFSVALHLLGKLEDKPDRAAKELELCVKLGPVLMMVKGPGSPEVEAIYSREPWLSTRAKTAQRGSRRCGASTIIQCNPGACAKRSLMPTIFSGSRSAWALMISSLRAITRSGRRLFGAATWPLQTSILKKAFHDTTAFGIMPMRSRSVVMILACVLTAAGRSPWRCQASLKGQCNSVQRRSR
jgi:hypothetical protein